MRLDFILAPIKRETGVDICLYTLDGEPEGSTGADLEYVSLRLDDFTDGVRTDAKAGRTYFIAGERHKVFGVIDGAGKEYRNYAVMIKRIVENELASLSLPDFNERMRLLLSGTANETQIVSLKANFSEPLNYYMFALMCAPAKQVSLLAFMRAFKENGDILVRIDEGTIAYARRAAPTTSTSRPTSLPPSCRTTCPRNCRSRSRFVSARWCANSRTSSRRFRMRCLPAGTGN